MCQIGWNRISAGVATPNEGPILEATIAYDGYLLDSPCPNRLWFWSTSGVKDPIQGDGLDCQRLLHEAKEELATLFDLRRLNRNVNSSK